MKITTENLIRAMNTKRELSRAADRAETAHEYLERIDPDLAQDVAAAIETLRLCERSLGTAIDARNADRDAELEIAR